MSKIDFTKPLRGVDHHLPYRFIGMDGAGFAVVERMDLQPPILHRVGADGKFKDYPLSFLENAPVTHERWLVVYQLTTGEISTCTFNSTPPESIYGLYHKVLAVKKVVIEEGEGLTQ